MTPEEIILYKKCTNKYRKQKRVSADAYYEQHEYNIDANEQHDYII